MHFQDKFEVHCVLCYFLHNSRDTTVACYLIYASGSTTLGYMGVEFVYGFLTNQFIRFCPYFQQLVPETWRHQSSPLALTSIGAYLHESGRIANSTLSDSLLNGLKHSEHKHRLITSIETIHTWLPTKQLETLHNLWIFAFWTFFQRFLNLSANSSSFEELFAIMDVRRRTNAHASRSILASANFFFVSSKIFEFGSRAAAVADCLRQKDSQRMGNSYWHVHEQCVTSCN